jgi:hypothetical protein
MLPKVVIHGTHFSFHFSFIKKVTYQNIFTCLLYHWRYLILLIWNNNMNDCLLDVHYRLQENVVKHEKWPARISLNETKPSLRIEVFWEKFRKWIFPPKMVESKKTNGTIKKCFPMNGHVSMYWAISVSSPRSPSIVRLNIASALLGHPSVTVARQSDWALFTLGINSSQFCSRSLFPLLSYWAIELLRSYKLLLVKSWFFCNKFVNILNTFHTNLQNCTVTSQNQVIFKLYLASPNHKWPRCMYLNILEWKSPLQISLLEVCLPGGVQGLWLATFFRVVREVDMASLSPRVKRAQCDWRATVTLGWPRCLGMNAMQMYEWYWNLIGYLFLNVEVNKHTWTISPSLLYLTGNQFLIILFHKSLGPQKCWVL